MIAELPIRTAQKPGYDIRHAGIIPGACQDCNCPPVEFIAFANQHLAFVRFYCHEHYKAAIHTNYPDGLPQEPL